MADEAVRALVRATCGWLADLAAHAVSRVPELRAAQLHSADLALREYQDLVNEHPQDKLYQAWKMYRFEHVLNVSGPPLAQLDEYQKLADAARDLGDKRGAILQQLLEASVLHIVPPLPFSGDGSGWALPDVVPKAAAAAVSAGNPMAVEVPTAASPGATKASAYVDDDDTCSDSAPPLPSSLNKAQKAGLPSRAELSAHVRGLDCFLRTLNINSHDYNYPMWSAIYATRNKVSLLVSWLLPGLYGLLGACVHLMREMLPKDEAGMAGHMRNLSLLSILLRTVLGGLSGVIIGWF